MATILYSSTPEITKRIAYNSETKDFDCFIRVDAGPEQYIGSASTHPEAEGTCRDYAFQFYSDNHTPEKAALLALVDDTQPAIPQEGPHVVTEAPTRHAMYLDGLIVGFARTKEEARRTLQELISEVQQMETVAAADMHAAAAQFADEAAMPDVACAGIFDLNILPSLLIPACPCLA
jgi:hypothetical protein